MNWKKYTLEFLSIFVAVILAFALDHWNESRRDREAEAKILLEIYNGLQQDKEDVRINVIGHKLGIAACAYWRNLFDGKSVNIDSLARNYFLVTRDFISIQNTSGYETLKSRGFELVENDSLRQKIISVYEFNYQVLRKLEEEYTENQFQKNYFDKINDVLGPHFVYNSKGEIIDINRPLNLSEEERNILFSYLYKIQYNREFVLDFYDKVDENIDDLMGLLESNLGIELKRGEVD